jgi:Domain of unknown function (DUF4150)/GHH signature containing HNH/Endo VII superfamily nuclease toxin  2
MADNVYANGRSVLHKGSAGKSMAAFPDVCLCPPPSPAGPIPTPLPNTAMASDIDGCSSSVLVDGNPVGHQESFLSTSTGNEVSKPTGGGLITATTKGKVYFQSFSFDVKAEGKGVLRHMDMGTHNHASEPGETPPWMDVAKPGRGGTLDCTKKGKREKCELSTFKPNKCPENTAGTKKTPHHIVPMHCFVEAGKRAENIALGPKSPTRGINCHGASKYRGARAPCICVNGTGKESIASLEEGPAKALQHGWIHRRFDYVEANCEPKDWTLKKAQQEGADACEAVMPSCDPQCIMKALKAYHEKECELDPNKPIRQETHSDDWNEETEQFLTKNDLLPEASVGKLG